MGGGQGLVGLRRPQARRDLDRQQLDRRLVAGLTRRRELVAEEHRQGLLVAGALEVLGQELAGREIAGVLGERGVEQGDDVLAAVLAAEQLLGERTSQEVALVRDLDPVDDLRDHLLQALDVAEAAVDRHQRLPDRARRGVALEQALVELGGEAGVTAVGEGLGRDRVGEGQELAELCAVGCVAEPADRAGEITRLLAALGEREEGPAQRLTVGELEGPLEQHLGLLPLL